MELYFDLVLRLGSHDLAVSFLIFRLGARK